MENTTTFDLPPLPEYTLHPLPPLVAPIPDKYLILVLPIVAYWALSMFFHWIDVNDYFPQYRLHTPAELTKRNHVSRWEVFRDVVVQQIIQTVFGLALAVIEPDVFYGKENHDIAVWAQRIRIAQGPIPYVLATLSVNASALSENLAASHPSLAGLVKGGVYPDLTQTLVLENNTLATTPAFASWELLVAKLIYHFLVPALQFTVAVLIVDAWQYFWHRFMHTNKYMYTKFHSRHHRLYVPYAYGALYNHPFEGFIMDTFGTGIAYLVAGLTTRQGMCFFVGSTFKTVDDHCGYALPFDPLQHLTRNNAAYHDIHHQSWGIKTNFSQPFFIFWDQALGTMWKGGDVSLRYERDRKAAARREHETQADEKAAAEQRPQQQADQDVKEKTVELVKEQIPDRPIATRRVGNRAVPEPAPGNVSLAPSEQKDAPPVPLRSSPRKQRLSTSGPSAAGLPKGCWTGSMA